MPQQLQTRGPVQVREYIADPGAQGAANRALVERVKVYERGPDVMVEAFAQNIRLGAVNILRAGEQEFVARLFGEITVLRADRVAFQSILQQFEDAVVSGKPEQVVSAWRRAMAAYDTMARDLATLAALPEQGRGAA